MKEAIVTQQLGGSAPVDYVIGVLKTGGASDDGLAAELSHGAIHAVVPAATSEQRALQFDAGGLLQPEPIQVLEGARIQEVPTSVPTLAKIVSERMSVFHDPVLWVHEPLLGEDGLVTFLGDELRSGSVRLTKLGDQVYLAYERGIQAEDALAKAIDSSMLSWHFLAFVTDGVHRVASVSALLKHSSIVLIGAYDGESALIWERRP